MFRYEIARSAEKAYDKIKLSDAVKVFLLTSPQDLKNFITKEEVNGKEKGVHWRIEGDYLHFAPVNC
jgi:hypothetical protein